MIRAHRVEVGRNAAVGLWLVAGLGTAALGQFLFLHRFLLHGGLFIDDWPLAATQHFLGTGTVLSRLASGDHERPIEAIYQAVTTALSGTSPQLHALWGFLTHLLCVVTVTWVARKLGMHRVAAWTLGLLVMLFPFSDSIWLWYAASHASLAIALAALGVVCGLRGLRSRPGWAWHLAAAACFALSLLTYQLITVAIILTLGVYWPRVDRRLALGLWAKDIAAVAAAAALPKLVTGSRGSHVAPGIPFTPHALLHHAGLMLSQESSLWANVLVPFGGPRRGVVLVVAGLIALGGLAQAVRGDANASRHARAWLGAGLAGAALTVTALANYVPAGLFYVPLAQGQGNRVNALAGIGDCLLALSLAMLLAGLLAPARLAHRRALLGALLLVPIVVGYVLRIDRDMASWNEAANIESQELAVLHRLGPPRPGTTDYVSGGISQSAPGVLAFGWPADLDAAVRLAWNDDSIHAWPVLSQVPLDCSAAGVRATRGWFQYPQGSTPYADATFTNLPTQRRVAVSDPSECRRALAVAPFPPES